MRNALHEISSRLLVSLQLQQVPPAPGVRTSALVEPEPGDETLRVERRTLVIGLHEVAAQFLEPVRRRVVGHAHGNHFELEVVSELDERLQDALGLRNRGRVARNRDVDLDFLKRHGREPEQ